MCELPRVTPETQKYVPYVLTQTLSDAQSLVPLHSSTSD